MFICLAMIDDPDEIDLFEHLFRSFHKPLIAYATKIVHNQTQAEDIVADAFIQVALHISTISKLSDKKQRRYLSKAVKHMAYDHLRTDKRHKALMDLLTDDCGEAAPPDPEQLVFDRLSYQALIGEILALPEKDRDILELRFIYELSSAETAKRLHITIQAVDTRVNRAKKKLKAALIQKGDAKR